MCFRLVLVQISLLLLLSGCSHTVVLNIHKVKFAVVAVADRIEDRTEVENTVSAQLQNHDFDAVASHTLIPGEFRVQDKSFRNQLLNKGVAAVLVLRPIEVGRDSSIESVVNYVESHTYSTVQDFVAEYRGDDFTTTVVVEIGGYRLTQTQTAKIWEGVVWLDGEVENREAGIARFSELILANVQNSRTQLRKSAGLPPLE